MHFFRVLSCSPHPHDHFLLFDSQSHVDFEGNGISLVLVRSHVNPQTGCFVWRPKTFKTPSQAPLESSLFWIRKLYFARTLCSRSISISEPTKSEWVLNLEKHLFTLFPEHSFSYWLWRPLLYTMWLCSEWHTEALNTWNAYSADQYIGDFHWRSTPESSIQPASFLGKPAGLSLVSM